MTLQVEPVKLQDEVRPRAAAVELPEFPCTPPQERCWFLEQLQPGNTALNIAVRWEIRGEVAANSIEQAFRTIIARHEILRTQLVDRGGLPLQEVLDSVDFALAVIELGVSSESEQAARVAAICASEVKKPFALERAPLIRATAMRAAGRTLLLVVVHQAVFDGWSIRVLGREVGTLIAAYEAGRTPELPELALQYGDYALWQQEYLRCTGFETERAYWSEQLAGAGYFELPTDRPRQSRRTHNGALIATTLSAEASARLESTARTHAVSVFNLGCAVVAAILHRVSGETDIVFGTQVAGRDEVDLEPLIGVFINNLVLRIDASRDPTFREFLGRAESVVHGALAHQKLPFHRLVELKNPPRDLARTPLIAINVILQRAFLENARYETFELVGVPSPSPGAFYDLNFQMVGRPEGWRMSLEYNTDLFEAHTAQDLLAGWKATLEAACSDTNLRLSELPGPSARRSPAPRPVDARAGGAAEPQVSPELEARVGEIWAEILGVAELSPQSNFFELGGHSLAAARMLMRIEQVFGQRFEIAELFATPVLRPFVRALVRAGLKRDPDSSSEADDAWKIVTLQRKGRGAPIIAINNLGTLYALSQRLGEERRALCIRTFDPSRPQTFAPRRFEDIAADYVRLILRAEPQGPYVLFGLCVHGVLALEIAQQLRALGQEVALVAMMNCWEPGYVENLSQGIRWVLRLHDVGKHALKLARGRTTPLAFLGTYRLVHQSGGLELARRLGLIDRIPPRTGSPDNDAFLTYLHRSRNEYRPRPYDGNVLMFRDETTPQLPLFDEALGWSKVLTGRQEVVWVPVMKLDKPSDPGVIEVVEQLQRRLD